MLPPRTDGAWLKWDGLWLMWIFDLPKSVHKQFKDYRLKKGVQALKNFIELLLLLIYSTRPSYPNQVPFIYKTGEHFVPCWQQPSSYQALSFSLTDRVVDTRSHLSKLTVWSSPFGVTLKMSEWASSMWASSSASARPGPDLDLKSQRQQAWAFPIVNTFAQAGGNSTDTSSMVEWSRLIKTIN